MKPRPFQKKRNKEANYFLEGFWICLFFLFLIYGSQIHPKDWENVWRGERDGPVEAGETSSPLLYEKQAGFRVVNALVYNRIYDFSDPSGQLQSRRGKHIMPFRHLQ